jgi:hypothetical protein
MSLEGRGRKSLGLHFMQDVPKKDVADPALRRDPHCAAR